MVKQSQSYSSFEWVFIIHFNQKLHGIGFTRFTTSERRVPRLGVLEGVALRFMQFEFDLSTPSCVARPQRIDGVFMEHGSDLRDMQHGAKQHVCIKYKQFESCGGGGGVGGGRGCCGCCQLILQSAVRFCSSSRYKNGAML